MRAADFRDLVLLAALWGGSFLFMRITAPEFGPLAMAAMRVAGAAAVLLALVALRGELAGLSRHAPALLVVGVTNSALPFVLFGFAALHLTGGLASIFNAATPLFGALIAWAWLRERLNRWRIAGLLLGFAGVAGLALVKSGDAAVGGPAAAVAACLVAPALYGFSGSFTKRHLWAAPPLVVAAGSQLGATFALAIPAAIAWPAEPPSANAWMALAALAVLCSGWAYILYFRLIAHAGPANAMTVTYLVPAFAVLWGAIFLDEVVTPAMVLGGTVILAGTALATGLAPRRTPVSRQSPGR